MEEERYGFAEGIDDKNKIESKKTFTLARKRNLEGNAAFAIKDASITIKAYSEAIEAAIDALSQDVEENPSIKETLAICHANKAAAAYLLPCENNNAQKALENEETAERYNLGYVESCIRQFMAYEALGKVEKANECLDRGRRAPTLLNDQGLTQRLAKLQISGRKDGLG